MENQTVAAKPVKPTIPVMQVYVEGKILRQRRHEKKFYTVIVAAASDVYSHPSTLEVRSDEQLGSEGDIVKLVCNVSSSCRQFSYTEKGTGISKRGDDMTVYFDVIAR